MNFEWELNRLFSAAEIKKNEPMARHTSWRVGGPAAYFIIPREREQITALVKLCQKFKQPLTVIGNGTNLLVREGGLRGVVLKIGPAFQFFARKGTRVRVGAGTPLPYLVRVTAAAGLAGLEPIGGIPGTVGGALIMNAGAFGAYIGDFVDEVTVAETIAGGGEMKRLSREDCHFQYRKSALSQKGIVIEVCLQLEEGEPASLKSRLGEFQKERLRRHPQLPSAGSVFKNFPGNPAGKLIEAAGGKGLRVGGAQVSLQHANFIVNLGGATANDILTLIARVRGLVQEKFKLELQPEVRIIGEDV